MFDLKWLALVCPLVLAAPGCATHDAPQGVAEVPECRQAAKAVPATDFDSRLGLLRLRADAYGDCMQERGYVLDEQELERRLLHKEQVRSSDPMGGDPAFFLAEYRQELRMNPALWRAGTR
jgi:hypothetical protein